VLKSERQSGFTICATRRQPFFQAGVNPKVVSERLGHSTIVLTLDVYSHVLPTMQEDAAAQLEGLIFRRNGAK
jgi:integrase